MGEKCTQAFKNLLVALCVLCSLSLSLYAESENRLGIRLYGSFLYTDTVPNSLFFFSDIEKNDSFELRKALRNHNIDTLVLSSKGGSVWEGLNMAGIIHDKGLTTYVPKLGLEGRGDCASACSFMFFAGKTREAEGEVGVHQFYSGSASESAEVGETEEFAQFTVSQIIGFLNEFETPPFVFERMFQQSEMYYFNKREMKQIVRTVTPLTQENRSEIEGFINEFLIELASFEAEEESQVQQKSEPGKSPPQKQQPAKDEPDSYTQIQIVKNIQTELNRLNCNAGLADGVIGNKTKSALARYATAVGKFIDEGMLQEMSLLSELQTSQVTCNAIVETANSQKTYTTNPKSLASSYKYETCARISNKRECSTGNLKLRRLKDGEYEFEEETKSPETFYGVIKVKGFEVELQMVDHIEGVAVPINGNGTIRKNTNEIIFPFSNEYVIETFGKVGINLMIGEIVDLQIRWF